MLVQEDCAGDLAVGCVEGLEHGERAVYFDYTKVSGVNLSTEAVEPSEQNNRRLGRPGRNKKVIFIN
jgi:uncharacterized membrane protein YobD (UPF0266 family)